MEVKVDSQELYYKFSKKMLLIAFNILKDAKASEDLIQDIFYEILIGKIDIQNVQNHEGFLFIATKTKALDILKKKKTEDRRLKDFLSIPIEDLIEKSDKILKVYDLINELSPQRKKILLYYINNKCSYKQIAEDFDISVNSVKTHLRKGLGQIRIILNNDSELYYLIIGSPILSILSSL